MCVCVCVCVVCVCVCVCVCVYSRSGLTFCNRRSKRPGHFPLFGFFYLTLKVIDERDIFRKTELRLLAIVRYQMINCWKVIFHLTTTLKSR